MRMASSSLLSVILALSMFSIGAVAERITNVYVTNFPLDTQGNLKVSSPKNTKIVTVFKNLNATYQGPQSPSLNIYNSSAIDVDGFNQIYICASVTTWTSDHWYFNFDLIGAIDGIDVGLGTSSYFSMTYSYEGHAVNATAKYLVTTPSIRIQLILSGTSYNNYQPFWALVSVSLYLKS